MERAVGASLPASVLRKLNLDAFLNGRPIAIRSLPADQTGACSGVLPAGTSLRIWFTKSHGSYGARLPLQRRLTVGRIFSEKDGREVPDTIAVTFDFQMTWVATLAVHLQQPPLWIGRAHSGRTAPSNMGGGIRHGERRGGRVYPLLPEKVNRPRRRRRPPVRRRTRITCRIGLNAYGRARPRMPLSILDIARRLRRTWPTWHTAKDSASRWRKRGQSRRSSKLQRAPLLSTVFVEPCPEAGYYHTFGRRDMSASPAA